MTSRRVPRPVPLPTAWTKNVKSALLHAISLATTALTIARGQAATSRRKLDRLQAELDRAQAEIALLQQELDIKDDRWSRLPSRRRPHYTPVQRMRILQLKAARCWSCTQAAHAFLVNEETLRSWLRRVDEEGERALVQASEPVNKYPDFVRYLVKQLKVLLPSMGKVRIAQILARAGLHLSATTVGRMLKESDLLPAVAVATALDDVPSRAIAARCPGHTWHVDLTAAPIGTGFWVPWRPFSLPQAWPFGWWVAIVVDHCSRAVIGFAVFFGRPTSIEMQRSLSLAIRRAGRPPKHIITDKGRQFWCSSYRRWCRRRAIRPRFGAVGKHGSIAIVERFIRSTKSECTRKILVPLRLEAMRNELACYAVWYNEHRPNQALGGRTPWEVYAESPPAHTRPRFEPRPNWPTNAPCASPQEVIRENRGAELALIVRRVDNKRHLPVVELRRPLDPEAAIAGIGGGRRTPCVVDSRTLRRIENGLLLALSGVLIVLDRGSRPALKSLTHYTTLGGPLLRAAIAGEWSDTRVTHTGR